MMLHKLKIMVKMLFGCFGCNDTQRLLYSFMEGELDDAARQKLQAHLSDCPECMDFVRTYRKTIETTHAHGVPTEAEMPPALAEKLREFIRQNPDLK